MTLLHETNEFNVTASINAAYAEALTAIVLPDWLTLSATPIVYNWSDIALNTPCFSFIHFTGSSSDRYQGRTDGINNGLMYNTGILEIDAWVSRDQKYNGQDVWAARLAYMKGMVTSANAGLPVVIIYDYTIPAAPIATGYKVNMETLNDVQVAADENPSIMRKRFLINYHWHLRA